MPVIYLNTATIVGFIPGRPALRQISKETSINCMRCILDEGFKITAQSSFHPLSFIENSEVNSFDLG